MTIMIVHADRKCLPAISVALSPFEGAAVFLSKVKRPGENASRAILAGGGTTPRWLRLDVLTRPDDVHAIALAITQATRDIGTVHIDSFEAAPLPRPAATAPDRQAFTPPFPI